MHKTLAIILLGVAFAQGGCASIFTGSESKVTIDTSPPGSMVAVIGGSAGALITTAKKYSDFGQQIVKVLESHLSPKTREMLAKMEVEELISFLVAAFASSGGMSFVAELKADLDKLPGPIRNKVVSMLGIDRIGAAPLTCTVKNGRKYAVVVYREGFRPKIESLESSLNLLVILNFLNAFLGVPIDIITGAWLKVGPERLRVTLHKRG